MIDLEAIAKRAESATPGPWECKIPAMVGETYPIGRVSPLKITGKLYNCAMFPINDAQFIAASRTDIPLLLECVRELREVLTQMVKKKDITACLDYYADGAIVLDKWFGEENE